MSNEQLTIFYLSEIKSGNVSEFVVGKAVRLISSKIFNKKYTLKFLFSKTNQSNFFKTVNFVITGNVFAGQLLEAVI